jgi:hypothetical protein
MAKIPSITLNLSINMNDLVKKGKKKKDDDASALIKELKVIKGVLRGLPHSSPSAGGSCE